MRKAPTQIAWVGAFSFYLSVCVAPAHPAPPLNPDFHPGGATCFHNKEASRSLALQNQGFQSQAFPSPAEPQVLVIRVDFTDAAMAATKTQTEAFFDNVRGFFTENSYGVFRPSFTVSATVHQIGALATYGADCGADIACHDIDLRIAAVNAEDNAGRDFSLFDQVMIYHAGPGQETTGVGNHIWSVYFPLDFSRDGQVFNGFTIVPEREASGVDALGVVCHEYGHQLGLPDLYDISVGGGRSTVGAWDVMDFPYTAAPSGLKGANPPHLGAWSKKFLGFLTPHTVLTSGTTQLSPVALSSSALQIPVMVSDSGPGSEFFLFEYRQKNSTATYDQGIPGSGLLVWHIDESIASNPVYLDDNTVNSPSLSGAGHRGVDLVEADMTEIYANTLAGEPTDAFTASEGFLSPQSDAFNGLVTGIVATGISGVGGSSMTLVFELPAISTASTLGSVAYSTSVVTAWGGFSVGIPPGAFDAGKTFFFSDISTATLSGLSETSLTSSLTRSGIGVSLGVQSNLQPQQPIELTLDFSAHPELASLSIEQMRRLTVARYVPRSRAWVPHPSAVDVVAQTITSQINHLSLFQVMSVQPAPAVADMRIFPNPMRPNLGPTYRVMNFSNLSSDARIRIFSVAGLVVRELQADGTGLAVWDGRNDAGRDVASGAYIAIVENADRSSRHLYKLGIER